ncbi:RHS repeat protein [Flavobacterium sp. LaA7.5]|nr:RHS repeat protein [Flavobacterium salilacus subsp. altitudinum]
MKYIYPFAAIVLLLTACNDKEVKPLDRTTTDWAFYKLEGSVKSVFTKSNELINDNLEPGRVKHENPTDHDTELTFNEEGMLILEKKLNAQGGPYEEITYNGREQKLEQIQYVNNNPGIKTEFSWDETGKHNTAITRRNPDNSQIDRKAMEYKKGKLAEKITYNRQNNPIDKISYVYDKNGNLTGENLYLGTEFIQIKNLYKYNNKNQKVAESRYDKDSNIIYTTEYEYNNDKLIVKKVTNGNGEIEYMEKMSYNPKGELEIKTTIDNFDNTQTIERFMYDDKGNKTALSVEKNNELYMKVSYTYNEKGLLEKLIMTDSTENAVDTRTYTYTYDDKGNWTEKIIIINGENKFIEKREITYYN